MDAAARLRLFYCKVPAYREKLRTQRQRQERQVAMFARLLLLVLLMCPPASFAQSGALWNYSCDHFMYGACLRVPSGMSLTYEVPADFGLHRIDSGGREVLTVYEGNAPQRPAKGSVPEINLRQGGYTVTGSRSEEGERVRYEVFVRQDKRDTPALHLVAAVADADERLQLAAVLGGFRGCSFRRSQDSQTLVCPRKSPWGEQLAEWVIGKKGVGSAEGK